jgi:archaellum component FlaC
MSDVLVNFNKIDELKNTKAGIGRTIKQLKILYENNDIDINSFTELFEKYSIKLETIESAIQNLRPPENKKEQNKLKPPLIQSTVR